MFRTPIAAQHRFVYGIAVCISCSLYSVTISTLESPPVAVNFLSQTAYVASEHMLRFGLFAT